MRLSIETLKQIETQFGEFDVSQTMGNPNDIYLRFGYWEAINVQKLQDILGTNIIVEEDNDYDDDCGNRYIYHLFDSLFYKNK